MNDNVVKFQRNSKTEIITPSDATILDMDKHMQMTMEYIADPYMRGVHISSIYDQMLAPMIAGYGLPADLHPVVIEHMKSVTTVMLLAARTIHIDKRFGAVASNSIHIPTTDISRYICALIKLTERYLLNDMQLDVARAYNLYQPIAHFGNSPLPIGLDIIYPIKSHASRIAFTIEFNRSVLNGVIPRAALERIGITVPDELCTLVNILKLNRTFVFIMSNSKAMIINRKVMDDEILHETAALGDQVIIMTDEGKLIDHKVIGI